MSIIDGLLFYFYSYREHTHPVMQQLVQCVQLVVTAPLLTLIYRYLVLVAPMLKRDRWYVSIELSIECEGVRMGPHLKLPSKISVYV